MQRDCLHLLYIQAKVSIFNVILTSRCYRHRSPFLYKAWVSLDDFKIMVKSKRIPKNTPQTYPRNITSSQFITPQITPSSNLRTSTELSQSFIMIPAHYELHVLSRNDNLLSIISLPETDSRPFK